MKINKEKLNLLNSIVKTEEEIERLNRLVKRLQTEYSSEERIRSSRHIYKDIFNSEGNFIDYIRKNNITEIRHDDDGIYVSVFEIESDNEFKKRKEALAERIDKIVSNTIPRNKIKLEEFKIAYKQAPGLIVGQ